MENLQEKLLKRFEKSPLDIGKLAKMLVGDEYLVDLCIENIKNSDDELCKERINEIDFEESYLAGDYKTCPRCWLNPNLDHTKEQHKREAQYVFENGMCSSCEQEIKESEDNSF